jgi:POT family proton-dependent oligopeptide transporter
MMGGWFLGTSYSEILAAQLGKLSSIEIPEGASINVAEALSKYGEVFVFSAEIGIGSGIVVLILTPLVKRLMHGVR